MNFRSHLAALAMIGALTGLSGAAFAQTKPTAPPAATTAPKPAEPLDINTATKQQLMTLDGIGDARSDAIIKGRPYRAKNELVDKSLVPQAVYDKIKDQIIAKQVAQAPASVPGKKN
ncbi:MAG: helix-hairpin-helix domain-containing protein [Proteobacteria bacterium]|nr:helix-hairpin-helix domain-containing protein [Pseudomonadota bacterium]